jgi:MYXO-CTERM domain-containing protein
MGRPLSSRAGALVTTLCLGLTARAALADTVVQVPVTGVLDKRSVTTLTNGQIVVHTLPTDGGNLLNGFATKAVAQMKGAPPENNLPDDGHFAADARHPEVVLNYSNAADAASPQTHKILAGDTITFPVPAATYSKMFLFFNGAAGGTMVTVTLTYADATDVKSTKIPDYYADIPANDPVIFNLATNLAKWDMTTKINEANHHNITGMEIAGMPGKTLNSIKVERANDGGNLVFWGATGIATSAVSVGGSGGAGGTGGAGGAAGGSGGAGGNGGATGGTAPAAGTGGTAASTAGAPNGGGGASVGGAGAGSGGMPGAAGGVMAPATPADDSGCGCRVTSASGDTGSLWLLVAAASAVGLRRRHARRTP